MFGIEGNAGEIVPNAQTHEVIACELLAGRLLAGCERTPATGAGAVEDRRRAEAWQYNLTRSLCLKISPTISQWASNNELDGSKAIRAVC